jgi:exopolyphosphatase/guanosine-5'-triphosphate,3'-diphosphate pyrophosphatase
MKPNRQRRRNSVLRLARQCRWHRTHSEHVTRLCLMLFDQLVSLHQLNDTHRELIEYGCLLHDIGWHISGKEHHKHAYRLIADAVLEGFSATEVHTIANIARYHRKGIPQSKHPSFAALPDEFQQLVRRGAALLRVADGLDRSHEKRVRKLRCRVGKRRATITVAASAEVTAEIKTAGRKGDLFEQTFARSLRFTQEATG